MDSRAFRINWLSKISNIFEIDRPDVIKWKLALIKDVIKDVPSEIPIHYIPADLTLPWVDKMKDKGFDKTKSTLWIVEGLLYYFTPEQALALMKEIEENSIKNSMLLIDVVNGEEQKAVSFRSSVDDPENYFKQFDFQAKVYQPGDLEVNYGRFLRPFPPRNTSSLTLSSSSLSDSSSSSLSSLTTTTTTGTADIRRAYLVSAIKIS